MRLEEYAMLDATALGRLVEAGELSVAELVGLARVAYDTLNPTLNAILEFYDDAESVCGSEGCVFPGVPFLRKDIGATEAGRLQEMGSRLFEGYRPTEDSYYIERARAGGLRIIGRSAVPELATSGFTESILNGITGNPWNLKRTAGGSTGGGSAAVAAGIVPMAHASDGGGSIRIPAAACGLVGLNPSRGRISGGPCDQDALYGLGREFVVCRSVRDMAAALDVFAGPAPGDPFIIAPPERPYRDELALPTDRLRVGVALTKWGETEVDGEVLDGVKCTAEILQSMGHRVEEFEADFDPEDILRAVMGGFHLGIASLDEGAVMMGRKIDSDTLEPVNLKLYQSGQTLPMSYAGTIFEAMRKVRAAVSIAAKDFDILLTPSLPSTARPHGEFSTTRDDLSAEEYMKGDIRLFQYLGVFNVTGQPSVSLPLAYGADGLPIGIQLAARFGDEATLVKIARDLEEAMPWHTHIPPVHASRPR
ncbi:MAG: amidase [Gammaproteobacteria bacterium]